MDLQAFIKKQHKLLDKFERDWEKRSSRDPKFYPIDLPTDTWDLQLGCWMKAQRQEEKSK